MIGHIVSHYKILEKLGEGGMGVVYKAEDTKLDRLVALKFLPERFHTSMQEKARFIQEAKAAAALNHPNVCSIIDIQEVDNRQFIVMEYIDGKTLKEDIPIAEMQKVILFAIQIAEALQAAHVKGIVHRDVKSENIMVTSDGRIKVMDFGLAKLKGSAKLTRTSSTVGTLAYMAPEQIQGGEADTRSDIFSFGVVLFEMLTGNTPFRGEHEAAIMYSIVNEEAEPIEKYREDASPELVHIFRRALEKDPNDRYQSVGDLLIDLRRLKKETTRITRLVDVRRDVPAIDKHPRQRFGKPGKKNVWMIAGAAVLITVGLLLYQRRSSQSATENNVSQTGISSPSQIRYKLAILPFHNLGGDETMNFLGFALADNIITSLSYVRSIVVRPSSSVAQYKSVDPVPEQIAKSLDVNVMLTGNYVREGDNLHLNAQLVDLTTNSIIWQKPIDVTYRGIISLQKNITDEIINGLQLSLTTGEQSKITTSVPHDPQAYEDFLRGKSLSATSDLQSLKRAIAFFDEAISREPSFAPLYAEKGYALIYAAIFEGDTAKFRDAQSALETALAIDPTFPDALSRLGFLYIERAQKEQALPLLLQAVEISPNVSDIHDNLSYFYRLCGLCDEAEQQASLALQLNPGDRRAYIYKMYPMFMRGRYEEAIEIGKKGLDRVPFDSQLFVLLGSVYYFAGKPDSLPHYSALASQADPQSVPPIILNALVKSRRGDRAGALALLEPLHSKARADMEVSLWMSFPYAELGLKHETVYWINAAMEEGLDGYPWLLSLKMFDKFRKDEEFNAVSEKMHREYDRLRTKYGKTGP